MSHALAVSSFPDPFATQNHFSPDPYLEVVRPEAVLSKAARVKRAKQLVILGLPSNGKNEETQTTISDDSSEDLPDLPYSPIVFRSFADRDKAPSYGWSHISDPGRYLTPASIYLVPCHTSVTGRAPLSTKESIAELGLSGRSPSPDYRFLRDTLTSRTDSQSLVGKHIPPRSNSLPILYFPSDMASDSSSRSHSPAPTSREDEDDCSEIVFAEISAIEAACSSRKPSHLIPRLTRSPSPSVASDIALRSMASALTLRPESRTSSVQSKKLHTSSNLDLTPYPLMASGAFGLQGFPILPVLEQKAPAKAKSKSTKPQKLSEAEPPADASDRSFKFPFKRAKRLRPRRSLSVSSVDLPSQSDARPSSEYDHNPAGSAVTLVANPSGRATPERPNAPGDSEKTQLTGNVVQDTKDRMGDSTVKITAHRVVGDVWEEQDLQQVIPFLRSLKFSGK